MLPQSIPLFPLPNVVLFPNVFLPLHIFEPRYRAMTADASSGWCFSGRATRRITRDVPPSTTSAARESSRTRRRSPTGGTTSSCAASRSSGLRPRTSRGRTASAMSRPSPRQSRLRRRSRFAISVSGSKRCSPPRSSASTRSPNFLRQCRMRISSTPSRSIWIWRCSSIRRCSSAAVCLPAAGRSSIFSR